MSLPSQFQIHKATMGTKVINPVARQGRTRFTKCIHCGLVFTTLGIPRHWNHCPKRPPNEDSSMTSAQLTTIRHRIYVEQLAIEGAINGTPTGPTRNFLTDANLHLMQAMSSIDEALKVQHGVHPSLQESPLQTTAAQWATSQGHTLGSPSWWHAVNTYKARQPTPAEAADLQAAQGIKVMQGG
jgi:hypothetical protein